MSSYHGWTHRPKAQGGTDPIPASPAFPTASFRTSVLAQQTVDTIGTFVTLDLDGFSWNYDLLTGDAAVELDGSSAVDATGTEITFTEPTGAADIRVFWVLGLQIIWEFTGVEIPAADTDQVYRIASAVIGGGGFQHEVYDTVTPHTGSGSFEGAGTPDNEFPHGLVFLLADSEEFGAREGNGSPLHVRVMHNIGWDVVPGDAPVIEEGTFWGVRYARGLAPVFGF